jgi:hypothetical protein
MDPITIITVVSAIVAAVFGGTGPILPSLWRGFLKAYMEEYVGHSVFSLFISCSFNIIGARLNAFTKGFLRGLGRQRLNNDIYSIMHRNAALERELYSYHRRGGMQRPIPGYSVQAGARGRQMEYIGY